jgi:hypothetical protein
MVQTAKTVSEAVWCCGASEVRKGFPSVRRLRVIVFSKQCGPRTAVGVIASKTSRTDAASMFVSL